MLFYQRQTGTIREQGQSGNLEQCKSLSHVLGSSPAAEDGSPARCSGYFGSFNKNHQHLLYQGFSAVPVPVILKKDFFFPRKRTTNGTGRSKPALTEGSAKGLTYVTY